MHGKAEESLHLVLGEWKGEAGWFREVLGSSPSVGRVLAGSRETRMGVRTGDPSPHPTDCRVGVWSPKGVGR